MAGKINEDKERSGITQLGYKIDENKEVNN